MKDSAYLAQAQHQVEQALLSQISHSNGLADTDPRIQIDLLPYPKVKLEDDQTLSRNFGCLFIYCSLMFSSVMLTTRIVSEKERHITGSMRSTGMYDSAYCASPARRLFQLSPLHLLLSTYRLAALSFSFIASLMYLWPFVPHYSALS